MAPPPVSNKTYCVEKNNNGKKIFTDEIYRNISFLCCILKMLIKSKEHTAFASKAKGKMKRANHAILRMDTAIKG